MNPLQLKSISELLEYTFYIPDYQRGYRWTRQQVEDLLNDVWEFITENKSEQYFLQPIVVKRRGGNMYEVIDGQQRLTTIFLILQHLNDSNHSDESDSDTFEIEYETRQDSRNFLKNIADKYRKSPENLKRDAEKNIDFFIYLTHLRALKSGIERKQKIEER